MKILLLGKNGQLGWELQRALAPLGDVVACGREQADMENIDVLRQLVRDVSPQIIVNAAAYTAVDKAESEVDRARRINAEAVGMLADECKCLNAWLVHYSTDYVFDGTKESFYTETDAPNPLSVYGRTKLLGEQAVQQSGCKHLIFRTSWVYAARGANFVKTMLRLAKERDELKVVCDQIGAPTSAELIADTTALCLFRLQHDTLLASKANGLYHLVAAGETSWHGYAQHVIAAARQHNMELRSAIDKILPITTAEYPLPARRPANSRLSTLKLSHTFGIILPAWQSHLDRVITELTPI